MLNRIRQAVTFFLKSEAGPTSVEYAVILGVIIVIVATVIIKMNTNASESTAPQSNAVQVSKTSR